ncbi:MAG: serine/threonine protein kinase [Candidatus Obscuribacterales bacterium]|nr:serine/threonine protein kinase [Candidatus Obscuribacterales bacterium]
MMSTQGTLQNRYRIESVLGQGGMGTVYLAKDIRLDERLCVVKELRDDFYRDEDKQRALSFFDREARMLARLKHGSIVQVSDYFSEQGKYFLVMEYVEGENLHSIMQKREGEAFDEKQVVSWAIEICDVLSYLHAQDPPVIYRDLKPSNIMISSGGQLKLVDFGIARKIEADDENTRVVSAGYSPPEQYWGAANIQSDLYALGATMFFLLTGKDPEPLKINSPCEHNSEVSEYLDSVVQKCMAQETAQRYSSARELREALLYDDYEEEPDNPKGWFTRNVAAVIFIVAVALVFIGWEPIVNSFKSDPKPAKVNAPLGSSEKAVDDPTYSDPLLGGVAPQKGFALQVTDEASLTDLEARPKQK